MAGRPLQGLSLAMSVVLVNLCIHAKLLGPHWSFVRPLGIISHAASALGPELVITQQGLTMHKDWERGKRVAEARKGGMICLFLHALLVRTPLFLKSVNLVYSNRGRAVEGGPGYAPPAELSEY